MAYKTLESKRNTNIRKSRIIEEHLRNIDPECKTYDDLIEYGDLVISCDELVRNCKDVLTDAEFEHYSKLCLDNANKIKELFFKYKEEGLPKKIKSKLKRAIGETNEELNKRKVEFANTFRECFDILARSGDFDSYCIALEWNRSPAKQFYLSRRKVLMRHGIIQDIQKLIDGDIYMLIIEAPVGIGKSVLGELFSSFRNGLNIEARGLIGNANDALTNGFYNDILGFMTSSEYRYCDIFKDSRKIITNASINAVYFGEKRREPNLLCRSIEVGATGLIHINDSGYLYMDDVIKTPEQANNKLYLQKLIYAFTSTFYDRLENDRIPVLMIGTPWSLYDLIAYLKALYGNEEWFKVNSTPAYYINRDGDKVSNFDYEGNNFKSVEYWEKLMKADDPVIASAKFLMKPVERAGRLFEELSYFRMEDLKERLKGKEKPYITNATDVAIKEGGDFWASGFFYSFESTKECYLVDIVYSNSGSSYTIPKTVEKYILHKVERGEFEEKEGSINKDINYGIGEKINELLKKKNYRCNINIHSGAGLKSKGNRIDTYANEIKGIKLPDGWVLHILDKEDRKSNNEYNLAIEHLMIYSQSEKVQGKQIDDFPDMLAMNFAYNIRANKNRVKMFNIKI